MFIYEMYINSSCNETQYAKENPNSKNVIYSNETTQILNINESMVTLFGNSTYNSTDQSWFVDNMHFKWGIEIAVPPSFWFENDARCLLSFDIGKLQTINKPFLFYFLFFIFYFFVVMICVSCFEKK